MAETAENTDYQNSTDNGDQIAVRDPKTGRLLPGAKIATGLRPETIALRQLKSDVLNKIAPSVIPTWLDLINHDNAKIRLGAVKLAVETIFPKQIIHNMIGKILHEHEDGQTDKIQGLLTALPQFGEFLAYKARQDANRVIDVEPDKVDQGSNGNGDK